MLYEVVESHVAEFENPIKLLSGEKVELGIDSASEQDVDNLYPGWIFCKKIDGSSNGWVPQDIIIRDADAVYGTSIEDYDAQEMTVEAGVIVRGIREMMGNWLLAINPMTNQTAWIPLHKVKLIG